MPCPCKKHDDGKQKKLSVSHRKKIVEPDIRRFRKFVRDLSDPESGWEYGNGDNMAADAKAFLNEYQRMKNAIRWALGYTDFRARQEGDGPYYWRKELGKRARL